MADKEEIKKNEDKKEEKKEPILSTNPQRNAYQLTINNPEIHGYTHQKIKELLIINFITLQFFCMADEIGANGTPHTHIYVNFTSRVRFSKIKKHFPEAHIEISRGSIQSNIDYIKKSGKWENTEKWETRIEGTYEEYGTVPTQKGILAEMEELFQMIKAGYTNTEILEYNNDYIMYLDKIDRTRLTLLVEKFKGTRRLNLRVYYISGATGTGKTRGILDKHGDSNVYRVSDYLHPFDAYECQPVMAFDEFRSSLKLQDMLNYCDIYPIQLPSRYANKVACYETVYIISNWTLEEQYAEVQKDNTESWNAFLRRIHEVHIYNADGTIDIYNSVEEYLHRNEKFHTPKEEDFIPFEQEELPF